MAVNRVGSNRATTGMRYTKAGMVWAASRNGRRICESRLLRADRIPIKTPRPSVSTVATRTVVSVTMLCSHSWRPMIPSRQITVTSAGPGPLTHSASPTATTTTSGHGADVSTAWIGLISG
jgi:hypothetical protein